MPTPKWIWLKLKIILKNVLADIDKQKTKKAMDTIAYKMIIEVNK